MIDKRVLCPERVRKIGGSFAFVEHRFLREGFWVSLTRDELLVYLLLVMAADRFGLSYYGYDRLCNLLAMGADDFIAARNGLIDKDLIAFESPLFQVLSLPPQPLRAPVGSVGAPGEPAEGCPVPIHRVMRDLFR